VDDDGVLGLAVASYAPSTITLPVGSDGVSAVVDVKTNYPFEEDVEIVIRELESPSTFPLRLLVPAWLGDDVATVTINGAAQQLKPDETGFATLNRLFKKGDKVELNFSMKVRASIGTTFSNGDFPPLQRDAPYGGVNVTADLPYCVVEAGPLTFALPLEASNGEGPRYVAITSLARFLLHTNCSLIIIART